jgi:Metallo-peptidase family M12/Secretion system C-terminal sorting domain/Fibronectin type III domain
MNDMRLKSTFFATFLFLLLIPLFLFGQQKRPLAASIDQIKSSGLEFKKKALFESVSTAFRPESPNVELSILELQTPVLNELLAQKPQQMAFDLIYKGHTITLELVAATVESPDFEVRNAATEELLTVEQQGLHFRGIVARDSESLVAISIFPDQVMGTISNDQFGNLNLGRPKEANSATEHVLFAENDLNLPAFNCQTEDGQIMITPDLSMDLPQNRGTIVSGCVRMSLEIGYELYQYNGNSVQNTVNYIAGITNQVYALYNLEQISMVTSQIYIWVTNDPYTDCDTQLRLNSFSSLRSNFNGNLAHLITSGNCGGRAWLNSNILCDSEFYRHGVSDIYELYNNLPTFSTTVNIISHEIGHNLGSPHTHACAWPPNNNAIDACDTGASCGGVGTTHTVMSYCPAPANNNGFGTLPGNLIRNTVQNATCLTASCTVAGCGAPTNITLSGSPLANSATFTWNGGSGNTGYNLQYRINNVGATWTQISSVTSPFTLSGLTVNTKYEVQIQGICASSSSSYEQGIIFSTECSIPTALTSNNITGTSATLDWADNNASTNWEIKYGPVGFDPLATGQYAYTTSKPLTLIDLTAFTQYDWYVRSSCSGIVGGYTNFAGPGSFATFSNNDCTTALNVPVNTTANCLVDMYGTTVGATQSLSGCIGVADDDVWFKFVASATDHTISVYPDYTNNINDIVFQVFSGNCVGLTSLSCINNTGGNNSEISIISNLIIGNTYYIRVYSFDNVSRGRFSICITTPSGSNDNCVGGSLLPVNTSLTCTSIVSGNTTNATQSLPGCVGNANDDVWYKFVATSTSHIITVTPNTLANPVCEVFSGNCNSLNSLYCIDNGGVSGTETQTLTNLIVGNTYFVRVYGWGGTDRGTFYICLTTINIPVNDECSGAITLPINASSTCTNILTGTNIGATLSYSDCYDDDVRDVWYKFTATGTSHTITVAPTSIGGMYDVVFEVLANSCSNSSFVCQNATSDYNAETYNLVGLSSGSTYYVRVYSNLSGITGSFDICITSLSAPPTPVWNGTANICNSISNVALNTSTWNTIADANGIVAQINPYNQNLSLTNSEIYLNNGVIRHSLYNNNPYLDRNYSFNLAVQPTSSVGVRLYFKESDYYALLTVDPTLTFGGLRITKVSGGNTTCNGVFEVQSGQTTTVIEGVVYSYNGNYYIEFQTSSFSNFFLHSVGSALPVELVNFQAKAQNTNNLLTWQTASEQNSRDFEIEKSSDGIHFSKIATIRAVGNTQITSNYSFEDKNPYNSTYYRLKINDLDDKFEYSNIINVKRGGREILVTPNPTTGILQIENVEDAEALVEVFDAFGKLLKSEMLTGKTISIEDLPNGVYVISVKTEQQTSLTKIIKQ